MKKLLAFAVVAVSFTACNDAKTTETTIDTTMVKKTDTVPVVTTTTTTVDTLKKSDVKMDTTKKN